MSELNLPPSPKSPPVEDWLTRAQATYLTLDWEKISYIVIVLVAIVTRFWGLGDRVVSHDESLHTHYSFQYFNGDGYVHTPLMHGPFLFHITALSYWLFGHNDLTARIPIALFGVILVIFPYFIRHWIGRRGALFASLILLISPYVTYYSRYIRHDVYVIVWALIIFVATWHYQRDKKEESLWWFAAGLALMFATKEVSFIYVAIFGSFLVIRLLAQVLQEGWLFKELKTAVLPLSMVALALVLLGGGILGERLTTAEEPAELILETGPQAADPTEELDLGAAEAESRTGLLFGYAEIAGMVLLGGGLFLLGNQLRPRIEKFPEFDLIVLYITLLLPTLTALLVTLAGGNPRDFNMNLCVLANQETMGTMQRFFSRLISFDCWGIFFSDGMGFTALFLVPLLIVSVAIGMWWHRRKWVTIAAIFHIIFLMLFTSLFTNPGGWFSGTVDSLGYWLEQQDVKRGSQPYFYYGVVAPLYEFLPLIFAFLAVRLWAIKNRFLPLFRFWVWGGVIAWLAFGLVNWWVNQNRQLLLDDQVILPGLITALVIFGAMILLWFFGVSSWGKRQAGVRRWGEGMKLDIWIGMFPFFVWWLLFSIAAYTAAGEKMPWLSIHFVIPLAFMVGWYFNERFAELSWSDLLEWRWWALVGLIVVLMVTLFLAIGPAFLGQIRFGDLQAAGQFSVGRFVGSLLVAVGVAFGVVRLSEKTDSRYWPLAWVAALFALLSLLTIRVTYMANFPNADYTTEYLVYAHGAPATKSEVIPQLETLSMRLYGDQSIRVYYDNETSWPYTWYLRNFPQRVYFGASPTPGIRDADVVLVGDINYPQVEPFLGNDYDYQEFTYLWWPMEDYRRISWSTIIGDRGPESTWGGVFDADVRVALWDIFFYRDYSKWAEVTGRPYNVGSWPLRRTMRMYIRNDAKALLWDRGVGATFVTQPVDLYAEGELPFEPEFVIGEGALLRPRNMAVAPDGMLYVADSGNHRIAIFDESGNFVSEFGEFGQEAGMLNEPWGIAVDETHVYIADTWNHRVQKFTRDGEWVSIIGQSGTVEDGSTGGGLFFGPRDILLMPNNQLLVTDTGNHRLQLFDRDGNFVAIAGQIGAQPGEFYEPVGIAASPDGGIYVADTWNERIQQLVFDETFIPLSSWEVDAWNTSQSIENKPFMVADDQGRIFVTDPERYRVLVFDPFGEYLGRMGIYSTGYDGFGLPNGITVDDEGRLYVVDAGNSRIMRFQVEELGIEN
ncbi:MAG: TIGR03663 family protein [Ardenticatenaceae bacterium]|nr:TIGR03663 family protein [Ardenticatenaceae bacterium]